MPLYLEPENLRDFYPKEIISAFSAIKTEVANSAITPRIALNLIRKYFMPLDALRFGDLLEVRKKVDWGVIEFIGVMLIKNGYSRGEEDPLAYAVHDFFRYCRKSKTTEQRLKSDHVLSSCKLCWRHPVTYKNYCLFHNPSDNNSNYKHALRWKADFDKVHNELLIGEMLESQNSSHSYKAFFPRDNQKTWLHDVRPNVWSLVSPKIGKCSDSDFLKLLLHELDWIDDESPAQKKKRQKIHDEILMDPHLISTMLGLAEAWIIIERKRNSSHGGKRENSGRKAKPS